MNDPFYCELLRANKNNRILIQDFTIYREADYSQLPDKIMGLEAYLKRRAWNDDENEKRYHLMNNALFSNLRA